MDEPKCSQHNRATCTSRLACAKVCEARFGRSVVKRERGEGRVRGRVARGVYAGLLWSVVADECVEGVQGRHGKGNKLAVLGAHLRGVSVRDCRQAGDGVLELGPSCIFHQLHLSGSELGGVCPEPQARRRRDAPALVSCDGRCRGGASFLGGFRSGRRKLHGSEAVGDRRRMEARGGALRFAGRGGALADAQATCGKDIEPQLLHDLPDGCLCLQ